MKLLDIIKRIKLLKHNNWEFTDYFIECKNIITNQIDPTKTDTASEFTCIRDYEGFCIYIESNLLDTFYKTKSIYNSTYKLINVSELRRNRKDRRVVANVYDKISPATVKIKIMEMVEIEGLNSIYLVYTMNLTYNDSLYEDLVNYTKIEEKY